MTGWPELAASNGKADPAGHLRGSLGFGLAAFGIFLFAAALGVRKKKRLWPLF
jgi:hypothetical protein